MAALGGPDGRGDGSTAFADVLDELQRGDASSSSKSAEDKSKCLQELADILALSSTQEGDSHSSVIPSSSTSLSDLLSPEAISKGLERRYLRPNDLLDQSLLDTLQV